MITFIESVVAPVFYKLLYMSVTALVVGVIIMLIRRFADKRFSPVWKYAMWGLVLVALIMPWRPQSNLAVMNTTERLQEVSFRGEYEVAQIEYREAQTAQVGSIFQAPEPSEQVLEAKAKVDSLHIKTLIFDCIIPAIWLCGVVMMGLFMLLGFLRLGRKIKSTTAPFEAVQYRYESILQNCRQKLGIKRQVRIVMQGYVKTPALFGLFCPKIILPEYAENLSDEHLKYVILHELSHIKCGDGIVNTLLLALQTIYWFNPLTWLLFKFIREDMEIANDAAVLKNMGTDEKKEYSLSLVEVLAGYSKPALAPRLLCMVDSEENITRRIKMIKLGEFFKKRRLIIAVSGLLIIAITATLFLTTRATTGATKTSPDDDNVYHETGINIITCESNGFEMKLFSDKKVYKTTEEIKIWATLEYIGTGDTVRIWHGLPYMLFSITDGKDFDSGGVVQTILTATVLNKGELYRFDYKKSGGWNAKDPINDFWVEWYKEEKLFLPPGKYTVSVGGAFSLSESGSDLDRALLCELPILIV